MPSRTAKDTATALSALTLDDVDKLMQMVVRNEIEEVEIESKGLKVRVRGKCPAPSAPPNMTLSHYPFTALTTAPSAPPAPAHEVSAPVSAPSDARETVTVIPSNLVEITSPMVGTFYRAPAPDAPPFVEVGDRITEETVICIVEAMKLMNEIKAETTGIVAEILVENGQPVEFGQPLFRVEPSE